jgi:hypothetical protein
MTWSVVLLELLIVAGAVGFAVGVAILTGGRR